MSSSLAAAVRQTKVWQLLRLSKNRLRKIGTRRAMVREFLAEPKLAEEVLRLKPYVRRALADRYWLEPALEHKEKMVGLLNQQQAERALTEFKGEFDRFKALAGSAPRLAVSAEYLNPQLGDGEGSTTFDRHYTYHPAWAARVLAKTRPTKHVDISSIISFAAVVSAFVPVDFYDFRPAAIELDSLYAGAADLTQLQFADGSIESLSCMHVIEHIGLGRYGDPLDPDGDLKAIRELVRVLAPGGNLLIATPVGLPRVEFNAHRVYDHEAFASYFASLELVEFALIEELGSGGLIVSPAPGAVRSETYGCGCFWFHKPQSTAQASTARAPAS